MSRNAKIGAELRRRREARDLKLRELARKIGMQPAYLSKVELGDVPASKDLVHRVAKAMGEDPDALALCAAQITDDLHDIVIKHPEAFSDLIKQLKNAPEHAILRVVREVRDGEW
jgi:transcriptional regulator with XRE-family HTH domain